MPALNMDEIIAALAESPQFQDPEEVRRVTPAIERLPEIIGDRLDKPVRLRALLAIRHDFRTQATRELETVFGPSRDWVMDFVLSPTANELAEKGELTFAELLRTSPATFLPRFVR